MINLERRRFFKRAALGGMATALVLTPKGVSASQKEATRVGSYIDLTLCDGCEAYDTPKCVSACRDKNKEHFPEPEGEIYSYWPRKGKEDWSNERDKIDRLTPYNWTFVEKVNIDGKDIFIPRRCMHCDNPGCLNLCPFGTIQKSKEGLVSIDRDYCMGGAKCRDTCPWFIPQRQAGVGFYLKIMPKLAGGGSMYKCDGCSDLVSSGKIPKCEEVCPRGAIKFGLFEEIKEEAKRRAKEIDGYLYGLEQAGGTGTIYISSVEYSKIEKAIDKLKSEDSDKRPGRPHMKEFVEDRLKDSTTWMAASLIAPIAGIAAGAIAVHKAHKRESKEGGRDE